MKEGNGLMKKEGAQDVSSSVDGGYTRQNEKGRVCSIEAEI
jgi:hypothetical protein